MKHSTQWNLTRESLLDSGLSPETPGLDVQRACGTSIEAAIVVANKIALGQIDAGIAGGVDTVSDPPIVFGRDYQQLMLKSFRARSFGARIAPFFGLRPRHFKPHYPGTGEPRTGLSMGQHTEKMARTWQIARADQDEFALASSTAAEPSVIGVLLPAVSVPSAANEGLSFASFSRLVSARTLLSACSPR